MSMQTRGVNYDTGFADLDAQSRPALAPERVERELRVIRDEPHATAVRLTGNDQARLAMAAAIAARLGLAIWYAPFTSDLEPAAMHAFLVEAARQAEAVRASGAEVVFVAGAEISLLNRGFLPGDTIGARIAGLTGGDPATREALGTLPARVNAFLAEVVAAVRTVFGGPVTYAAVPLEQIDWAPFDLVSLDFYLTGNQESAAREQLRAFVAAQTKPVAITEFGAATYTGAAGRGAQAGFIVEFEGGTPVRLDGDYTRNEAEQAAAVAAHLALFADVGVSAGFVFTFISEAYVHRSESRLDLDRASYGLVAPLPDTSAGADPWRRKAAFAVVADAYAALAERGPAPDHASG